MKYAINPRGRKIRVEDKDLSDLLLKGFREITKAEFELGEYVPNQDKGFSEPVIWKTELVDNSNTKIQKRNYFKTRMV